MLVLTRKQNEEIVIDDGRITICIVNIQPNKVRVGITAPNKISVDRKEVYERKLELDAVTAKN